MALGPSSASQLSASFKPLPGSKAAINVAPKVKTTADVTVEYIEDITMEHNRPFRVSLATATSGMVRPSFYWYFHNASHRNFRNWSRDPRRFPVRKPVLQM
jgi:hypothetical protein